MIIDVHYHLLTKEWTEEQIYVFHAAKIMGRQIDREALTQKAAEIFPDPTGERVLATMKEAGIDFTMICVIDNVDNPTNADIMTQNQTAASIAKKHPNRLMALAGIDPAPPRLRQASLAPRHAMASPPPRSRPVPPARPAPAQGHRRR